MTDYAKEARRAKREGDYSKAGDMFFLAGDAKSALDCYVAGNHLFLAARLLEKIQDWKGAARYYIQCGKYLDAAEVYSTRLHDFRSASHMFEKQGDLARASEMAERAGEVIRAALMAEQADFKERAASLYLRARKYERAADVYFRYLQQLLAENHEKGYLESHRSLVARIGNSAGSLLIRLKNYDRAAFCYEAIENIDKAADCYALSGHPEKAAQLFHRIQDYQKAYNVLAKLNPRDVDRELLADVCFQLRRYTEAADLYMSLGRTVRAAEALEQGGDLNRAATLFESMEENERAAEVYLRLNDRKRAAEFYEKAKNYTYAAKLYEENENVEKAIACLQASGQLLHAAQLLIKRQETESAMALLQKITPEQDDYMDACALLGSLFSRMGMHSVALQKFQEAVGGKPLARENMDIYYEMAVAWEKANYYSKARQIYEGLIAEQFAYRDVLSRLEKLRKSNLLDGAAEASSVISTSSRILAGRYELMERIGKDAFGSLYKARDTSLGRNVMIRRLPEQDDSITRSLVEQTRAVSSLSHSNILAIYDSGKEENNYYICTEFLEGLTLREHLSKKDPDISEICEIATQVCLGLAYAHKKGVLHRCLTPENIYVGSGQVKIANFGFESRAEKSAALLARQYISPEQVRGEKLDSRSDLYSFGVILYEMLYGEAPFRGSSVDEEHLHRTPAFEESSRRFTPAFLVKIIRKCLEKDRQERYQNAEDILDELEVADIVPGMVLNERYEIIKELGSGGMGHVYQARDRDLDEIVALKVLRAEISADPIIQKRFVREIKVTRMITHPNVVKVFDIGKYKGNRYISMEFIQGTSLDEWLRTHPKSDIRVLLSIIARVIQGVQAAHVQGIIHRDLKPQNVILDRGLNPRVLDFGIARSEEAVDATSTGQILGSPKYMSPEQIQGRDLDARSDIYSLGIIMFIMFTGREPFTGDDPRAIIMKHLTQPPPDMLKINPALPAWLERIVMKAMEKDRNRRYGALKDMLDDLKKGYENLK